MIDHISLRTAQFPTLVAFYEATLAPLGYVKMMEFDETVGFGKDGVPDFWVGIADGPSSVHVAMAASDRPSVDAAYAAAMANGGKDNGAPGLRPYAPTYYAAFVLDPDGNNLEVVCHAPA